MLRDLIKEGGLYTIANLLTKGVSLLLIPFYTAYFTTEEYGIIDILSVFGAFINGVFSLQIYQGLARFSAEPNTSELDKKKYLSTSLYITLLSYTVFLILVFCFSSSISTELLNSKNSKLLLLCSVSLMINNLFYFLSVYIRFQRKVVMFTVLSFINSLGNILLILLLVFFYNFSIEGIYIASIIIGSILTIYELFYLRKNIIAHFSKRIAKKLFIFSLPLIPATISFTILNFTDRWFIKEYLSLDELGVYGIGYKFGSILILVMTGFSLAIAPIMYEKHADPEAKKQLSQLFDYFTNYGLFIVFILALFSYETLYVFTNEQYYDAQYVMPVFYYLIGISGLNMFSLGLRLANKTKLIAWFSIIAAAINILLNIVLIPKYYLLGAATATFIGTLVHTLLTFYYSQKYYPYKHKIGSFFLTNIIHGFILYLVLYFDLSTWGKCGVVFLYFLFLYLYRRNEIFSIVGKLIKMFKKA